MNKDNCDKIRPNKKIERLGQIKLNKHGDMMKIVEYKDADNIIVEFQDQYKERVKSSWKHFEKGNIVNPLIYKQRLGKESLNYQGCLMKIVEYINSTDIIVEFQDEYRATVHTTYNNFKRGQLKNPYCPSVFNVGVVGNKYPIHKNLGNKTVKLKEYNTWLGVLERCYSSKYKNKNQTYKDAKCCEEWLYYPNFYEWLHKQSNFEKWYSEDLSAIDKDILIKGNKVYSPETCCLVPYNVNSLFTKCDKSRSDLPIGVRKYKNRFRAMCVNPFECKYKHIGIHNTLEDAFYFGYKPYKENIIKQVAQIEYDAGKITKQCYEAMMKYEVEITD